MSYTEESARAGVHFGGQPFRPFQWCAVSPPSPRRACSRSVPHDRAPRCPCVRDAGHPRKCLCEHGLVRDWRRTPRIGRER